MKKLTLIFGLFIAISATAQTSQHPFENWMDTVGLKCRVLPATQFYLGGDFVLIRDTASTLVTTKKDGTWLIHDAAILCNEGTMCVFDHDEYINGRHIIWVAVSAEIKTIVNGKLKKTMEKIVIPFKTNGSGRGNAFALTTTKAGTRGVMGDGMPAAYFTHDGHIYEISTSVPLMISSKSLDALIKAQGISVRDKN